MYRIVQESLNNCSRHAQAKSVQIIVRQETERFLLAVKDDGKGFDPRRTRGLGLVGMTERVSHLGGVLKVDSNPGGGACLRVDLPIGNEVVGPDNA